MGRMAAPGGNDFRSTRQATTTEVCMESIGQRCVFFKFHTIRGDFRRGVARTQWIVPVNALRLSTRKQMFV